MEPGLDWDRWLGPAPKRPYNSTLSPRGVHDHFPAWRSYREYSGGGMTDWGAHHFDIAQWGLGMDESGPVEIIPPEDEKSEKGVTFVYDNGVKLIHGGPGGACFIGEKGVILVNRGRLESHPQQALRRTRSKKARTSSCPTPPATSRTGSTASGAAKSRSATSRSAPAPSPSATSATSPTGTAAP